MDVSQQQQHTKTEAAIIAKQITTYLNAYNQSLDIDGKARIMFSPFGQIAIISNLKIGHIGSKLILFQGISVQTNVPFELLQHIAQLNIQLSPPKKDNPGVMKNTIGFLKR
ncbi:DUF6173 family protein [Sporosarcina sp. FSL K6-3457]|uniref:DUF6173 family protein n=1 Tax=Sporosarcina sp. FSL K6-3457 TaxID=2978204 RepID=UPI0030F9F451